MTRRRPAPGFSVSTKGHSVLRKYAYSSPPPSRRYGYSLDYSTISPVKSRYYSGEEDYIDSAVQRATSIGSDALYDTLDTANMSRNRDYDLLSATNSAIVNTETHSSPRAAVASLRARSRPQTQPQSARRVSPVRQVYQQVEFARASSAPPLGQPVVVFTQPRQSRARRSPIFVRRDRSPSLERSRSVDRDYGTFEYLHRSPSAPRVIREALDTSRRPRTKEDRTNYLISKYERSIRNAQRAMSPSEYYETARSPSRTWGYYISPANARRYRRYPWQYRMLDYYAIPLTARRPYRRYWRTLADTNEKAYIPYYELTYNPRYQNEVNRLLESLERPRSGKRKRKSLYAAIVASKLEDEPSTRRRRPRSKYAADKYRATHKVGENPLYYSPEPQTVGLTASRGTVQKTTDRKAVRDAEGNFTKPKNILSWQYRLDSRVPPEEILYRPTTFNRMRERLHEAQDKMDRHRQLLDRYIPEEGTSESIESRVNRKLSELEQRDSSGGSKSSRY